MHKHTLTPIMLHLLGKADLVEGTIDNVPHATVYALARRGLITDDWHRPLSIHTETGRFPHYSRIKLSPKGLLLAHELQQP